MRSPIPHKHARIEIIPLIDIMFFLLASFMMVSLSQTHMKGIRVNLPTRKSPPPPPNQDKDYVSIRVAEGGLIYFDNVMRGLSTTSIPRFSELHEANPEVKVSLSAETAGPARRSDRRPGQGALRRHREDRLSDQDSVCHGRCRHGSAARRPGAPPPPYRLKPRI